MKNLFMGYFKIVFLSCLMVFAPAKQVILTAMVLCFVDLITGLLASRKQNIPITSQGLKRTVLKLGLYLSAILLSFLTQQYLTGPFMPVMTFVSSMIGVTELTSIFENLNLVAGGNVLTTLIQTLQKNTTNRS